MRLLRLLCVVVVAVGVAEAGKILFLGPVSSKSHKNFYNGIVTALAKNGNQITMVSPYKPSKVRSNVREVVLPDTELNKFIPNLFGGKLAGPIHLMQTVPSLCSLTLGKQEMQDLLKEKFDLIMLSAFFSDCFLSVVHQMKVPLIYVVPAGFMHPMTDQIGNPSYPSFIPAKIFDFKLPMTLPQRMINSLGELLMSGVTDYYVLPKMEQVCRERGLCPDDMPSLYTLRHNTSLLLLNSVKTIDSPPRPIVPAVIHLGGINCGPAQPLPKDLDDWVKGAGSDGYIFFSLGSAVTPSSMSEEHRRILVSVFGSLKQRVLWKWNQDTMDDLPPNVRLGKWLPQQDILGDSRLKLFITHGGLLSTLESMYHGVPVLGMPVFGDQETNMREVERDGWGSVLTWDELTADALREKINFVMGNKELQAEVARRSAVMKDQPQHPSDVAVFWVEYVMRHNGAAHLRCPIADMSWVKMYNVDVWTIVVVTVLVILWLTVKMFKALIRCLCSAGSKRKLD